MAIPSLLGGILFHALPESPKFLMSRGRNEEALHVFREVYRRNHNSSGVLAISALADEKYVSTQEKLSGVEAQQPQDPDKSTLNMVIKAGLTQMLTIFDKPHLRNCLVVFTMQFGFLWSQNTMRLWLPSILGMIADYEREYVGGPGGASSTFDLCRVIESSVSSANVPHMSSGNTTEAAVCSQVIIFYQPVHDNIRSGQRSYLLHVSLFSYRWSMAAFTRIQLWWV